MSGFVQLLFSRSNTLASRAIQLATWSDWSHVSLLDGDHAIEAVMGHGVRRIPTATAIQCTSRGALLAFPARDPARIIKTVTSQIGKPYDYSAVFGLGLRRDWQEDDAWFCSELVAWAFQQAGEPLFRAECLRRVTPQHLYMLPALTEVAFN